MADVNKYLELAFGDMFEPLPEAAQGKCVIVCSRKTADAIRRGITVRGEEIKAQPAKKKKGRDESDTDDNDDDEAPRKSKNADQAKGEGKKRWFKGCYGCGEDRRWTACHLVGPLGQRLRCTGCGKRGHLAKVCADAAPARMAFVSKYGKPWEYEQNLSES